MHLCIVEDLTVKNLHPLTYLNPVFELHCGCTSLREKIISFLPINDVSLFTRPYLSGYVQETFPGYKVNSLPDDDVLFVNGTILADSSLTAFFKQLHNKESVAINGNKVLAAFIKKTHAKSFLQRLKKSGFRIKDFSSLPSYELTCQSISFPWDLVRHNTEEIINDFLRLKLVRKQKAISGKIYKGAYLLNKKNIIIGEGTVVKPGVVLDAEQGPIVIGKHVTIMPNAVIEGPVFIGEYSTIRTGTKIYPGTSIGSHCKIGGEVTRSIIQSYSNKAHDGFIGDSYIGSWVNLGADTNTSNLKNTYGNVSVPLNGKPVDSGEQFVGLTMGDHSKSGINVMFNTGTIVGVSCNIYGADFPPKYIPSFSWGSPGSFTAFEIAKSIEIARRMMARRGIALSNAYKSLLQHVFQQTRRERTQWLKK